MEGVILFADDKLMDYTSGDGSSSHENQLFRALSASNPVLGVKERDQLESSINSIGSFSAVILDWQFDNEDNIADEPEDDETVGMVQKPSQIEHKTFELLMKNEFYSLVYVYSTAKEEIEAKYGDKLRERYNNRIEFRDKSNLSNIEQEAKELIEAIEKWKEDNKRISIPISWSQSINRSVQSIFASLNSVDPNWIKELYDTAKVDGVTPSVEVLNLFQNILSEKIIQDKFLRDKIDEVASINEEFTDSEKYAELIRILYYGYTLPDDPIMTGDIFCFDNDKYGLIITPECDIRHISGDRKYEVLTFSKKDYKKGNYKLKAKIKSAPLIIKAEVLKGSEFTKKQKEELSKELNTQIKKAELDLQIEAFTQTNHPRLHILPCFEFEPSNYSGIALIDFRSGLELIECEMVSIEKRIGKLNTPYIQELRQRYLAYKGRVGVPGYSRKLREWLIDKN
jgi:hypothetical protein